jgi:hypothetical protein
MSYGDRKVPSVKYGMLPVVNRDRSGQEGTLYEVNKKVSATRRHALLFLEN